jgi:predicted ribosome quality control (RQC) complex YloA/Tae2 family protein
MQSIEIPGTTLHFLVEKWNQEWKNAYVQQMRTVHENTFLIKIHASVGNKQILIGLPHVIVESNRKWENMDEQPSIVNATKKLLDNLRITKVTQVGTDRIIIIHGESANIIVELFGGGNLIVTNGEGIIQFVHFSKEWKGRTLKMKEKYVAPQNERKNSQPFEEKMNQCVHGFELVPEKNRMLLIPVFEKTKNSSPVERIFEIMEEQIIEEWKKPKVDSKLETQKEALRVNAERQRELLNEWENKIVEQQRAGEWVYEHFAEVQQLLDAVQRGMKQNVSAKKMTDEIRKKLPFVKNIDVEKGTIDIEPSK